MINNQFDAYLEGEILSADPVQLVRILYRAAIEATGQARQCLREGDITGRGRAIAKASAMLNELNLSLNHEAGGEVSRNLAELYDYLQRRLMTANFEQVDPPLIEVENLLFTLLDGWAHPAESEPEIDSAGLVPEALFASAAAAEYQPVCYSF